MIAALPPAFRAPRWTLRTVVLLIICALTLSFSLQSPSQGATVGAPIPPGSANLSSTGSTGPIPVGGGGFVTGLSFSDDGATRAVRTDTFGGYRWDGAHGGSWALNTSATSLPASVVRPGLGDGVLAVAVAPSNASIAYMAYDSAVFKSIDGARSWVQVRTGISTAPNDDFRPWGSRLTVDPTNPDVVYYGTQLDGLYITRDGGLTWSRVDDAAVPAGIMVDLSDGAARGSVRRVTNTGERGGHLASAGVSAIAFDRSSPKMAGRTSVVYAASYGHGIYRSADAGQTWTKIGPADISAAEFLRVLSNGDVLVTAHSNPTDVGGATTVWRMHAGQWTQTTPLAHATDWHGIAGDPLHPGQVALIATGGQLALSSNYGATWRLLAHTQASDDDVPWLAWSKQNIGYFFSPGELVFDPVLPGRLWLTEGTGVWYADMGSPSTRATTANWHSQTRGVEQLVATDVIAPPGGKPLLTAWDRPIFRAESLTSYPTHYAPTASFGSAWSIDWSASDPNYIVASVASHQWPSDPSSSGYSADGGKTWTRFPTIPMSSTNAVTTFGFGTIAVSSPGNIVWVPAAGKRPQYTKDGGKTWSPITLPGLTNYSLIDYQPFYVHHQVLAADRATPGTFYLYVLSTGLYRTADGGDTWTKAADNTPFKGSNYAWNASLKAVPGSTGELYLTPGQLSGVTTSPFQHSTDAGTTWTNVPHVTGVTAFGYGKALLESTHPTIYVAGYLNNVYGIYYSTDDAHTWSQLTTYPEGKTAAVQTLDGDKDTAGLAYFSLAGAGWSYASTNSAVSAAPSGALDAPTSTATPTTWSRPNISSSVLSATVRTTTGSPVAGSEIGVQRKASGSNAWRTWRTVRTDQNGRAQAATTSSMSGYFRFSVEDQPNLLGSVSSQRLIKSRTRLRAVVSHLGVFAARLTRPNGASVRSARVRLQIRRGRTSWRTVRVLTTHSDGMVRLKIGRHRHSVARCSFVGRPTLLASHSQTVPLH